MTRENLLPPLKEIVKRLRAVSAGGRMLESDRMALIGYLGARAFDFEACERRWLLSAAPAITAPTAQTGAESTALVFSAANSNQISIADASAGATTDTVTLSEGHGTFNLASATGLTFTTGSASGSSTVAFSGSIANINNALNGLQFNPTLLYTGNGTLHIGVTDSSDSLSGNATMAVKISANSGPTVATSASATPSSVSGGANSTDLSVLGADVNGESTLTYTWSQSNLLGYSVIISNNGTNAAKNTRVTFQDGDIYTFTCTISDPQGKTATSSVTLLVVLTASNNTPTVTVPGSQLGTENTPLVFSSGNGNAISVSNNSNGQETITLAAASGVLSLSTESGLTLITGNGTNNASMSFSGSLASINAALNGLTFTPTANYTGAAEIVISASLGNNTTYNDVIISIAEGAAQPPTVATAASAQSLITGKTSDLSVLGADADGESSLTYSWSAISKPTGAASPSFSDNGDNSAQNTVATFSQAGNYTLQALITDPGGLTTTSDVNVDVVQTLNSISVTPSNSSVGAGQTEQFSAQALDQFGAAMASQPTFSWSATSGVITSGGLLTAPPQSGNVTVTASSGGIDGIAATTIVGNNTAIASPTPVWGNTTTLSVVGGATSGVTYTWSATSVPNGAADPTFSANGDSAAQTSIATFTQSGNYTLQVAIDSGTTTTQTVNVTVEQTLSGITVSSPTGNIIESGTQQFSASAFDQFNKAMQTSPTFAWSVSSGQGAISQSGLYTAGGSGSSGDVTVAASSGGVTATGNVTVVNAAPTVATAAAISSSPVTGTSALLSVLGADDGGESNLTYTWAAIDNVPAAVSFSNNGTNSSQNTSVTFTAAGSYTFEVTITDAEGQSVTSTVDATVNQTVKTLSISPPTTTTDEDAQQQFTATATDQFGNAIASPTVSWSMQSGNGSITSAGLYTAPATSGAATIFASSGSASATANVTIPNSPPTVANPATAGSTSVGGNSTTLSVLGADDGGEANLVYQWSLTGTPPAAVSYSDNDTNSAKNTTVTFSAAGEYDFLATITDLQGASVTSPVTVDVTQTLSGLNVTSANPSVERGGTAQFSATAVDQFGAALTNQPNVSWSIIGGSGSINSAGLFSALNNGVGIATAVATSGGVSGTGSILLIDDLSVVGPGSTQTAYQTPLVFSGENAITVNDADANTITTPASLTISATEGQLTLGNASGLTFSSGNGTANTSMEFSGPIGDLDNALAGLVYTPTPGFQGNATVTLTINETGAGAIPPTISIPVEVSAPPAVIPPPITPPPVTPPPPIPPPPVIKPPEATSTPASGSSASSGTTNTASTSGDTDSLSSDSSGSTSSLDSSNAPDSAGISVSVGASAPAPVSTPGDSGSEAQSSSAAPAAPAKSGTVAAVNPASAQPAAHAATPTAKAPSVLTNTDNSGVGRTGGNAGNMNAMAASLDSAPAKQQIPDVQVAVAPEQVFPFLAQQSQMTKELDQASNAIKTQKDLKIAAGSATVVSFGASAAYVLWLLRGGSLLSSMLSIFPAWRSIDPLPVLDNFESRKNRKARIASDKESLESLVDQSNSTSPGSVPLNSMPLKLDPNASANQTFRKAS